MPFSANIQASLFMMLSMLGFVLNDALVKSLQGGLPTSQIMCVRGAMLAFLIFLLVLQRGLLPRWPEAFSQRITLRAMLEGAATLLFLSALPLMAFANLSAILQALPLAVTLGAALFFGEPVGWRRWLAIGIGFVGVLIIIRPGFDGFNIASVFVLLSVVFAAGRDLITRNLPVALPSLFVSGFSSLFIAVLGLVLSLYFNNWVSMTLHQTMVLLLASFFLFFGYQFIIMSMRIGDVAYVVPYRYTSLLWSILFGFLFFNEMPDAATFIGSAVVVSMGLYTLYRELRLSKQV